MHAGAQRGRTTFGAASGGHTTRVKSNDQRGRKAPSLMNRFTTERPKDRLATARRVGLGSLSPVAVLAGILVGYGGFAVLAAIGGVVVEALDVNVNLAENWQEVGTATAVALGVLLFASYLFAGYVTGRMAWRAGTVHGALVFAGSLVVIAVVAALARRADLADEAAQLRDTLEGFGIPTSADQWGEVGTVAAGSSLAGMLLGSLLGGRWGEHWHTKLSRRAAEVSVSDEPTSGERHDDVEHMTRDELYQLAQQADIPRRSQMSKEELKEAVENHDGR